MEMFSQFIRTFLCGGILCLIGQILIDKTSLTPAKILTLYVVGGVVLGAVGVYEPIAKWGGAGATVPLTGFGYALAKEVRLAVASDGFLGAMTGGITAAAGGITAAIFFGWLVALLFSPREKN
jgi:stage V sporulation protein AE